MTIDIAKLQTFSIMSPLPITFSCEVLNEDLSVWRGNVLPTVTIMVLLIRSLQGAPTYDMLAKANTLLLQAHALGLLRLAPATTNSKQGRRYNKLDKFIDKITVSDKTALFWEINNALQDHILDMCLSYTIDEIFASLIPTCEMANQ